MRKITAATFVLLLLSWATGCGTAPGVNDPGVTPCEGTSCEDEPPPESVCLEHVAADILDDGCGVFLAGNYGFGDDRNPGTKAKPVYTVARAIELARAGRGRVFLCNDGFIVEEVRVPSGVDLLGGFHCRKWVRDSLPPLTQFNHDRVFGPMVIVEPAGPEDTGAADGVSTLADLYVRSAGPVGVLVQSNTAVEILRSEISARLGSAGSRGETWQTGPMDGPDGNFGGHACSATVVAGAPAAVNQCESGHTSIGGKGGDGLPDSAEDGGDGEPASEREPSPSGIGGTAEQDNVGCHNGSDGGPGAPGTQGAPGTGIGRLTETGWEGDAGGAGTWGTPGQGGGGGGGRRGGLAVCGVASKGGPGGGSGGAGGCGGRGGRGGGNGQPSIGVLALHARVTVRDTKITADDGGGGGYGGEPQDGRRGGRGAPGGMPGDELVACHGGRGGQGGPGGYGGPGRGGDSIGVAYLDEDQLTLEGVTIETGQPGKGGTSWNHDGSTTVGESGEAHKTLRFPE
ncbi:putative exported protein with glycine-rich central and C-terminal region [Sorangium cellulosum So ce56]|uniref:Exported protein with glycine-rich central and C-terminal region n=1 Tax=Sorangium cellulosum (strain So ce56) TaxID=448385 RepID=A9GT04_SORC5|nr:hypothetical protein [Sorangium cellulosum]CAN96881.1 putative exported protein with glycine-rich central and C-terminal region [Sorangium cellulosum So ce56]